MTSGKPLIRIIIVAFRSEGHLDAAIRSLASQTFADFEVEIIDNGGAKTTSGYHNVKLPDARFRHQKSPCNDGFSGGFSRGATSAETPLLMSINPDTVLDHDCLEYLVTAWRENDHPAMMSPVLFRDKEKSVIDGLGDCLSIWGIAWRSGYDHPTENVEIPALADIFAPTGAAALYDRQAYEEAGKINVSFFCYLEDVDLALRIRANGGRCLLVGHAQGVHVGGHSTKSDDGFALKYTARNNLAMIVGSAPFPLCLVMTACYSVSQTWLQIRSRNQPTGRFKLEGHRLSLGMAVGSFKARFSRKPYGLSASWRVGRHIDWGLNGVRNNAVRYWDETGSFNNIE